MFDTKPIAFAVRDVVAGTDLDAIAQPGQGMALWLHAPDAQDIHDALAAAGTTIVSAPIDGHAPGRSSRRVDCARVGQSNTWFRISAMSMDWPTAADCCAASATRAASMPSRSPARDGLAWFAAVRQNAWPSTPSPPW